MTTTVNEIGNVVEAIRKVNRDIRDYYWMANQINIEDVETYIQSVEISGEATLPKAPYTVSDPTYRIVQRNIRIEERQKRMLEKVVNLENAVATLKDERERIVIEGCIDKMTLRQIGTILGISKQAVYEIKEKAVRKLAIDMYLRKSGGSE